MPVESTARLAPDPVMIGLDRTSRSLWEAPAARAATGVFFAVLAVIVALPALSHAPWMIFVQDDFLYYLKVAQNIAHGHGSTFNGVVNTNGYQPLWLLMLVVLSRCTEDPRLILTFLAGSAYLAAALTFFFSNRLLRSTGARPLLVFALSAFITIYSVTLFFYGMEVTLAVPLILAIVCLMEQVDWLTRGPLHTFVLGLLLSAMVLSRIDTLILGGLLLAGIVLTPELRRLVRVNLALGALIGLAPLVLYLSLNRRFFYTWLPVSGLAKQLRSTHVPSIEPWRVFFHPLAAGYATLLLAALAVFFFLRRRLSPMRRVLFPAILIFPFVYYFILSCVSDWTLWGWYMYPLRTAICVAFCLFCLWPRLRHLLEKPPVVAVLLLIVFGSLAVLRWTRQQTDIYASSVEIQRFASTHPGTYAMGDRSGRVAYMLPNPVIQLEGLMMDREYLRWIEQQRPLREVLSRYHVRYYVATAYQPYTGCFQAAEPAKGGPTSAKMRATFCETPAATYLHDGITTLIYEVEPQ